MERLRKLPRFGKMALLALIAVLSVVLVSPIPRTGVSDAITHYSTDYINKQSTAALLLSGGALTTSYLITALPDDAGTTVADQVDDVAGYAILIIGALLLEKYIVTVAGFLGFGVLIPLICLILIIALAIKSKNLQRLKQIAVKTTVIILVLYAMVPASISVCKLIDFTNDFTTQQIETEEAETETEEKKEEKSDGIISDAWNFIMGNAEKFTKALKDKANELITKGSKLIEDAAIMIVESCVIPLLTLWLMSRVGKYVIGSVLKADVSKLPNNNPSIEELDELFIETE